MKRIVHLLVITALVFSYLLSPSMTSAQFQIVDREAGDKGHKHSDEELLFLPLLSSGQRWQKSITLINPEDRAADLQITAVGQGGEMIENVAAISRLAPSETRTLTLADLPNGTETLKIRASHHILSHLTLQSEDGGKAETIPALGDSSEDLVFPSLISRAETSRSITLFNPNASHVRATATALNAGGGEIASRELKVIAANETRTFTVADVFGDRTLPEGSTIRIASDNSLVGLQIADQSGGDIVALPALNSTSRSWTLPLNFIADGRQLTFRIGFFNPGAEETALMVSAFDAEGTLLFSEQLAKLAGGATSLFNASETLPKKTAIVQITAEQAIRLFQIVSAGDGRGVTAAPGSLDGDQTLEVSDDRNGAALSNRPIAAKAVSQEHSAVMERVKASAAKLAGVYAASTTVSNGFDFPIGSTGNATEARYDSDGWYVALNFPEYYSGKGYHLGEDWNGDGGNDTDCGQNVYAASSGVIEVASTAGGWGNYMIVRHQLPDGTAVETLYGHLQSFAKTSGTVTRREYIGKVGSGGGLYPCHLHLEVRYSNCSRWGQAGPGYWNNASPPGWTDPTNFINARRNLSTYEGYHDAANCDWIEGWAWDRTQPNTAINVDIYDGSTKILTVPAGNFRQDLLNAGKGNGYHGFKVATPNSLKDRATHTVYVKFAGTSSNLGATGKTLTCETSASAKARMTSPANGSTFNSSTVTFNWDSGLGVNEYFLYVGNSPGGNDIYGASQGLARSRTVSNLPTDGRRIYVRLWSRFNSVWDYNDYVYTAYRSLSSSPAAITSPANGSTLWSSTVTFSWTPGVGVSEYFLYVGTCSGCNNIYGQSQGTSLSRTVNGIPASGMVYVRLWSLVGGTWYYNDYAYTASR